MNKEIFNKWVTDKNCNLLNGCLSIDFCVTERSCKSGWPINCNVKGCFKFWFIKAGKNLSGMNRLHLCGCDPPTKNNNIMMNIYIMKLFNWFKLTSQHYFPHMNFYKIHSYHHSTIQCKQSWVYNVVQLIMVFDMWIHICALHCHNQCQ